MKCYFKCLIGDSEVEVEAYCSHGSAGSYEEPPEGLEIDISKVEYKDRDISPLIARNKNTTVYDKLAEDCGIQFEGNYNGAD